jgi:glycosyltransferase involved in cell wall biosynthesis
MLTPVTFGGAERVSLNFLKYVDRKKFNILPILFIRPWENEPYFVREIRKYGYTYVSVPVALQESADPLRVFRAYAKVYSYLKRYSFDLVHTHGYFADICALPVARLLGFPAVSTCHGFINNDTRLRLYARLDLYALRMSYRVFCVSMEIRDILIENGIPSPRIRLVNNAVQINADRDRAGLLRNSARKMFGIGGGDIVLGFCGRLSPEKGVTGLLEAAATLREEGFPIKVMIIGDGPERSVVENVTNAMGLKETVIMAGFREDARELMALFDVFVLPSLTEGTPMALLEAMSIGLPVVASAVGEIPALIRSGENGILISPGEADQIVYAVRSIMENSEFRDKLSTAALETIRSRFGLEKWVQKMENYYLEVINNRGTIR